MSLLSLFGLKPRRDDVAALSPDPFDDYWYNSLGTNTAAGVRVNEKVALTLSACWAATMLIASAISMMPLKLLRKLPNGGSEPAEDDPRYWLVNNAPNVDMTSFMFRSSRTAQQVNWGNAFSEIQFTKGGVPISLNPIHASRIPVDTNITRGADGRLRYFVNNDKGGKNELRDWQVLHVPSPLSEDGIVGRGVVTNARLSIGLGLATEQQGAAYFGNSARPKLVIEGMNLKKKEDREEFLRQWAETHGLPENNARPALLPTGAKVTPLQFSAEDSQFLETRQFNVEDISRWYGIPPHMIQSLLRSTNNNITQQALELVKYSLTRWMVPQEQEFDKKLLTVEERKTMYFRHDVDELERADLTTRTAAYKDQTFNGAMTINQWCAKEHRNPIGPIGDIHWVQQAMVPVEIAAKGPQPATGQPPTDPESPAEDKTEPAEEPAGGDSGLSIAVAGLSADLDSLRQQLAKDPTAEIRTAQKQLAAAMLNDVMARMVSVEIHNVKQVAQTAKLFRQRLETFYGKHKETMLRSLNAPFVAYRATGGSVSEFFIDEHITESLKQLDALAICTADELAAKVEACVGRWHEERAAVTT